MKRVVLDRPFTQGIISDQPAYKIGPQNSAFAQDLIAPEGIARQRKGWAYDGSTADVSANLAGVHRNLYLLNDNTRTVTTTTAGSVYRHNSASSGTLLFTNSTSTNILPRCVYRDELILCAQDGISPLRRYAGAVTSRTVSSGTPDWVQNEATITGMTLSGAADVGSYAYVYGDNITDTYHKIIESTSTSSITLDGITASSGATISNFTAITLTGLAFPAVPVYNAGTITVSGSTVTGYGTKWVDTLGIVVNQDAVLIIPATGVAEISSQSDATPANTSIAAGLSDQATKSPYAIMRQLPFKDAAAHKGSLWGTGVAQYPNTVYVGPPGWNIAFPPGFTEPVDVTPSGGYNSENANDFIMDQIAVPTAYDGDVNIAILSSPSPLLVLKRAAVYGIFGAYPNFSVDKIEDGIGCIDIRSAVSTNNGQFWAGEHGIYAYVGGQVVDLTRGKINREWRALTRDFDYGTSDYCAIGQAYDHLFVSIVTGGGTTNRCYVYDMANQAWTSRFTNHKARYFFSAQVDGEEEELYWVGDNDQGRVMKSAVTVNATGIAKDGDGDSPRMQAWTGQGMDGSQTADDDARMLDLAISHNVYDAGAAGSTVMGVSVVAGGSLEAQANATKTLTSINSDTVDRVDRTRFREVNTKGRLQQVRIDVSTTGTNTAATKIEVPEMTATFRERRSRT